MELAVLADSETWRCFPGLVTLSDATGYCRDTVINALAVLEKRGFIHKKRRQRRSTVYTILEVDRLQTSSDRVEVDPISISKQKRGSLISTMNGLEIDFEPARSRVCSDAELEVKELEFNNLNAESGCSLEDLAPSTVDNKSREPARDMSWLRQFLRGQGFDNVSMWASLKLLNHFNEINWQENGESMAADQIAKKYRDLFPAVEPEKHRIMQRAS